MNVQLARLSCAGVGVALLVAACAGKALNDVGDVHGDNEAGAGGAEPGGGGKGGVYSAGGVGTAGRPSGDAGDSPGGKGGTGNEGPGGADMGNDCDDPRIVPLFDFTDGSVVQDTSGTTFSETWVKYPYESTDTGTGKVNNTNSPPSNPKNLANMSKLSVDGDNGFAKPALSYAIPFLPWPSPLSNVPEQVNLVYAFANSGEPMLAVDFSHAKLVASALLLRAPNENCTVSISAWTTATDPATGTGYTHVDGLPAVKLEHGKWATIEMDLSRSMPAATVNQVGFLLKSKCNQPAEDGAGGAGAGGAGAGGADAGAGGTAGPGPARETTVVLIDNIRMFCE